jgi:broad specificity phosphatase PhoE
VAGGPTQRVTLVRHGATEWSESGRHTGRTDVPLTEEGRWQAAALAPCLAGRAFAEVLTSPLARARETARLAGFPHARVVEDLREWDYGDLEGRTTPEIRGERPGWLLWRDGAPNGETIDEVGARADAVLRTIRAVRGDVCVVAHGHVLRILTARWLGLDPAWGRAFALGTASLSTLGYEREVPVIAEWNVLCPPAAVALT